MAPIPRMVSGFFEARPRKSVTVSRNNPENARETFGAGVCGTSVCAAAGAGTMDDNRDREGGAEAPSAERTS